jgi:DNA-binding NtrC family response regulator
MGKARVLVVDADQKGCRELCAVLAQANYPAHPAYSLKDLEDGFKETPFEIVILNLDTVPANNQLFRALKSKNRNLHILSLSSQPYHPGLEEAMSSYIYACLVQPLNREELLYWLKSIGENESGAGAPGPEPSAAPVEDI